jgi:hypothetical protein
VPTAQAITATVRVQNTGGRSGADIVQLYGRDVVASITRPVIQLLGYARVELEAGQSADVTFDVPTTRFAFSDRRMIRVVEPGQVEVSVGASCAEMVLTESVTLTGDVHEIGVEDRRVVDISIRTFTGE